MLKYTSLLTLISFQIPSIYEIIQWGGLLALIIIVYVETGLFIGFLLPGDSLLVTAGLFAAKGELNIIVLNIALIIAAILGDSTGYYIGLKAGPALFSKPDSRFFKREHLIKTKEFYEKHGGKALILARFVPIIRTFTPVMAGISEMNYKTFVFYNIIGGITWVFSMTMLGFTLVKAFPATEQHIEKVIIIVVFLSILPGIIEYIKSRTISNKG